MVIRRRQQIVSKLADISLIKGLGLKWFLTFEGNNELAQELVQRVLNAVGMCKGKECAGITRNRPPLSTKEQRSSEQ